MSRSAFGAFAVVLALGVAVLASISGPPWTENQRKAAAIAAVTPASGPTPGPMTPVRVARAASGPGLSSEANLADDGHGDGREEREARRIEGLVALDRIGEAHTAAMLFIQDHPSGPFSAHVMNLMGVHPRPAGAVPRPRDAPGGG